MVDEGLRLVIQGLTPFALRATALERTHRAPPPPIWGRIEVGEASDDCLAPKRGFPFPNLPHAGGGEFPCALFPMRLPWSGEKHRALRCQCGCSLIFRNFSFGKSCCARSRCQALRARNTGSPLWSSAIEARVSSRNSFSSAGCSA